MTDLLNIQMRPERGQNLTDFKKAGRVIESCENIFHIKAAKSYINLFFNKHSKSYLTTNRFRVHKPSAAVIDMYNDLYEMLIIKQKALENV
jgi:hypothetical protein